MKKRLIALVLALTMLADSPGMLYASQLEPSTEYSSREEETDSGVTMKEITSDVQPAAETGDMTEPQESQDFVFDNGTITGYTGTSSEIVIPEEIDGIPVTEIGLYAFSEMESIVHVSFPATLKKIGNGAFRKCRNLEGELIVPDSVEYIGVDAFNQCTSLTSLSLGNGVKTIEGYAFYGCIGLTGELVLPENLEKIGEAAFRDCTGLSGTLKLPDTLKTLESGVFYGCSGFSGELDIPDQVKQLESKTFYGMSGITGFYIGASVEQINLAGPSFQAGTFDGCTGAEFIKFRSSVPPDLGGLIDTFSDMTSLKRIWVPAESYKAYNLAYQNYVPDSARVFTESSSPFISDEEGVLNGYVGEEEMVWVPDGITAIGVGAFRNNTSVKKIVLPAQLTSIGKNAFAGCTQLAELQFLGEVPPDISENPDIFQNLESLTALKVPLGFYDAYRDAYGSRLPEKAVLSETGAEDFQIDETVLTRYTGTESQVRIPEGITEIAPYVFQNNAAVKKVIFPESLQRIGDYAFDGCSELTSLELNQGLQSIGICAFQNCGKIEGSLTVPSSVRTIEAGAFSWCSGIDTLALEEGIASIGTRAFRGCSGITGTLRLPDTLTAIEAESFMDCSGIENIFFPRMLERIGRQAFENCTGFQGELIIPDTVTTVEYAAFKGMNKLPSVVIGENVEYLNGGGYSDSSIFYGCTSLETITFLGAAAPYFGAVGDTFSGLTSLKHLIIPRGSYESYIAVFGDGLPEGIYPTEAGAENFVIEENRLIAYFGEESAVQVPEGVTSIGTGAFYNRTKIEQVILPDSVQVIGESAFKECGQLKSIQLGAGIQEIKNNAFRNCSSLAQRLELPGGTTKIGDYAFSGCVKLSGLELPEGLSEIGKSAFENCTGLTGDLSLPNGLEMIESSAFYNCFGLSGSLTIPETVKTIQDNAFAGCHGLTGRLMIPDSVTEIGQSAFYNCSGFTGLTLSENLTRVRYSTFYGCSGVEGQLIIPDRVVTVEYYAFCGMEHLTSAVIGSNVETLNAGTGYGDTTFEGCSSLEEIKFLGTVPPNLSNGTSMFRNLQSLKKIRVPAGTYQTYMQAYNSYLTDQITLLEEGADEFLIRDQVLVSYSGTGTEVQIPGGVTEIGTGAFLNNSTVQKVHMPDSVVTVSNNAFKNCAELREINFSANLKTIRENAFSNCANLQKIALNSGLRDIGGYAFYNCSGLNQELVLPDTVEEIGDYAFFQCTNLTGLTLSAALTKVGTGSFWYCKNIAGELRIPESLTWIANYSFADCQGLTGLSLPDGMKSIQNGAFSGCTGLSGTLRFPDSITYLGDEAFSGCSGLTGLKLSENLESVTNSAFRGCTGIEGELVIPDKVTYLGYTAFAELEKITSVVIGAKVTLLGGAVNIYDNNSFLNCTSLERMIFKGTTPPELRYNTEMFRQLPALKILQVPGGSYGVYAAAYGDYLPEGVVIREEGAEDFITDGTVLVHYAGSAEEVQVPEGITEIGTGAFLNNTSVSKISLPDTVEKIGVNAFRSCGSLKEVALGSGLVEIGDYAFYQCRNLTQNLVLPEGLKTICTYAFAECEYITGVTLPPEIEQIGSYAFYQCTGMTGNLTIPGSLKRVEYSTFEGCRSLTGLTLGEGVENVAACAFRGCQSMAGELYLPDSITLLDSEAFASCKGFTSLRLSEHLTMIPYLCFAYCAGLEGEIRIPDSVTTIGNHAFYGLSNITAVTIGRGVATIYNRVDDSCFSGCNKLEQIRFLGDTPPDLYNTYGAFRGLPSLARILIPSGTYRAYTDATYATALPDRVRMTEEGSGDFVIKDTELIAYCGTDEEVNIPEGITIIGREAFRNNQDIKGVNFPRSLQKIDQNAFKNCTQLAGPLKLPDQLTGIGESAFQNCSALSGVLAIPDNVAAIDLFAFQSCSSLSGLRLGSGVEKIGRNAFENCTGLKGDLYLPDSLATLEDAAFSGCSGLDGTLRLSGNLTVIHQSVFANCSSLSGELIIPDKVQEIYSYAFLGDEKFTSLTVGKNVKIMNHSGGNSFYGCTGIRTVTFLSSLPPDLNGQTDIFTGQMTSLTNIYVLGESLEAYRTAYGPYLPENVELSSDTLNLPPGNFRAAHVYSNTVHLTWNPCAGDLIEGYYIYRDQMDAPVADLTSLSFTDAGLTPGKPVTYYICGYTADKRTTKMAALMVTPKAPAPAKITTDHILNKVSRAKNTLYASVEDTGNLGALDGKVTTGQFYYLDEQGREISIGGELTAPDTLEGRTAVYKVNWDLGGIEDGMYTVGFRLTDIDGKEGTVTQSIFCDNKAPDKISSLAAVGDTNKIVLSWSIAHEIDTKQYYIYRRSQEDGAYTLYKKIYGRDTLTWTDTTAEQNIKYYYYIVGVNDMGLESPPSDTAAAVAQSDKELPRVVKLLPANGKIIGGTVELYAQAEDNVAVTETQILLSEDEGTNWTLLEQNQAEFCRYELDTAQYEDGVVQVKGIAKDAAGNISDGLIYTYKIDNQGPEQVTGLEYESTATTVTLKWADVADQDFSFFRVERKLEDGSYETVCDEYRTLGVNITGLKPDSSYTYRVTAYDLQGNRGTSSEEITAATQSDSIAPVITSIDPKPGYYRDEIPLCLTAWDDSGVASVEIQTSTDIYNWKTVTALEFSGDKQEEKAAFQLNVSEAEEGNLYVRGVAADKAGNTGDATMEAPYVQYIVDHTPPKAPEGLAALSDAGYIELRWNMGEEQDLDDYLLYRAEGRDGEYQLLAEKLYALNYIDRTAKTGVEYRYRLQARDYAGNKSAYGEELTASMAEDTDPPEIQSVYPADGAVLGPSACTVSVLASDNYKLKALEILYQVNEEASWRTLKTAGDIDGYYKQLTADLPIGSLQEGDSIRLKAVAQDAGDNQTESEIYSYTVDKTPPTMEKINVSADSEKITLAWTGGQEEDLAGYRIYRKDGKGEYQLISQRSRREAEEYSYSDYGVEKNNTYYYKVEATDRYGNAASRETESVWLAADPQVRGDLICDLQQEVGVEYVYDASGSAADLEIADISIDYGDGTAGTGAKTVHRYSAEGTYTVTLKVTDSKGNTDTLAKSVEVTQPKLLGTVRAKVQDNAGNALSGVPVYFDLDRTAENVKYTDTEGYVTFAASAASYAVGTYKDGYLPVKKTVVVRANTTAEVTLTMVHEPIVTGNFEINRMTLDEIRAAGIDVSKPENQHVVKVNIHLTYGSKPLDMELITNGSEIFGGGTTIVDTEEGDRQITANVVPARPDAGGGSGTGGGFIGGFGDDDNVIIALMDVPVEASCLKEFFDVKLHILNHASKEFNLSSNQVQLNVPEGLTVVDAMNRSSSSLVNFPELPGQAEKTLSWVLRGDQEGKYEISVDYSSVLDMFQAPVQARFVSEEPITVYGLSGLSMKAVINKDISNGAMYFDLGLSNNGQIDYYLPTIDVMGEIIKSYKYEEDKEEEELEGRDVSVMALNATLSNGSTGYAQILDPDKELETLHAGETYMKRYVAYGAIQEEDPAYIQSAIAETLTELSIPVEISFIQMNLFDMSSPDQKVNERWNSNAGEKEFIMDIYNTNFYYFMQSIYDEKDFWKNLGEFLYRSSNVLFKANFSIFTDEDKKKVIDSYIVQLLADESFDEAVDLSAQKKYLDMAKGIIGVLKGYLKDPADLGEKLDIPESEALKIISNLDILSGDEGSIRKIAKSLELGGTDTFTSRLVTMIATTGSAAALNYLFQSTRVIEKAQREAMSKELKYIGTAIDLLGDAADGWIYSCEFTNTLVKINQNKEEAMFILDTVINAQGMDELVVKEAKTLKKKISDEFDAKAEQTAAFIKSTAVNMSGTALELAVSAFIKAKFLVTGPVVLAIKAIVTAIYGGLEYLFAWEASVENLQKLRYAGALTKAFRDKCQESLNSFDNLSALRSMKYLIKMRLLGEKAYITSISENKTEEVLSNINSEAGASYKSLNEYYWAKESRVLYCRDILFNTTYQSMEVPEAPAVSINYEGCCTAEAFGKDYEYSWDGVQWTEANGQAILFIPKETGQMLWVRKKASSEAPAGNITKRAIPSAPYITDEITCSYKNGAYTFQGLTGGTYQYLLTDQTEGYDWTNCGTFTYTAGLRLEAPKEGTYLVLRRMGSNEGRYLTSVPKSLKVNYPVQITAAASAGGTAEGTGEYLAGETAVLKAVPDNGYEFLGWYYKNSLVAQTAEYQVQVQESGTYEARFKEKEKGRVVVSCEPANSGQLTGGGYYLAGEEVTISAAPLAGWEFLGWYRDGQPVTEAGTYAFTCTAGEIGYTARFRQVEKKKVVIHSEYPFTINGRKLTEEEYKDGVYTGERNTGETLLLEAENSRGNFAYWAYGNGQIVSRSPKCTVSLAQSMALYAVYNTLDTARATVLFLGYYGQIIDSQECTEKSSILLPPGPSRLGYTFKGWSMTADEIRRAIAGGSNLIEVKPEYEENKAAYLVTLVQANITDASSGPDAHGAYPEGTRITAEAAEPEEGKKFSHWEDERGFIHSYRREYTFILTGDISLHPVYADSQVSTEESPVLAVTGTSTFLENKVRKMDFTVIRELPDGYTFLSQGMLYTTDAALAKEETMMKGCGAAEELTGAQGSQGMYRLVVNNVIPGITYYCRSYVVCRDENGLEKVIYSNIASNIYIEERPVLLLSDTKAYEEDGTRKLSFTSVRTVPEDCRLLELGFVYTTDGTQAGEDELVLENEKLSRYQAGFTSPDGIFTLALRNAKPGVRCYCRAYLIYTDRDGNQHTVYSNTAQNVYLEN